MARLAHKPNPIVRRQVEAMAGYGVPEADIAGVVGVSPKTLRKHYRSELDHGHVKANAKVAENLYRKATGEGREASSPPSSGSRPAPAGRKLTSPRSAARMDRRSRWR